MSKGKQTRDNILNVAFTLASESGLESLTIGELAKQCGMSKSGLFAHFNSKENLQAAVVDFANDIFLQRVIVPARADNCRSYEEKIKALLHHWLNWNQSFQGSCMFLDAWREKCADESAAQRVLKQGIENWLTYLQIQIGKGIENNEFRADLAPEQATFELYGMYLSAHLYHSMHGQEESTQRFWHGVERQIQSWK